MQRRDTRVIPSTTYPRRECRGSTARLCAAAEHAGLCRIVEPEIVDSVQTALNATMRISDERANCFIARYRAITPRPPPRYPARTWRNTAISVSLLRRKSCRECHCHTSTDNRQSTIWCLVPNDARRDAVSHHRDDYGGARPFSVNASGNLPREGVLRERIELRDVPRSINHSFFFFRVFILREIEMSVLGIARIARAGTDGEFPTFRSYETNVADRSEIASCLRLRDIG